MISDIKSLSELEEKIKTKEAICIYFGSDDCNVCKVLRPKIHKLLKINFPKMDYTFIDIKEIPAVSSQFSIHTVPVLIIFFNGKEFIRKIRNISLTELETSITRPYTLMFQ